MIHDYLTEIQSEAVALQRKRIIASVFMDAQYVARSVNFTDWVEPGTQRLGTTLRAEVLSETLPPLTYFLEVQTPASWWDHFKSEQVDSTSPLWRWVARRWPAKMVTKTDTVRLKREHLYPDAKMALPKDQFGGPVLKVRVHREG